MNVLHPSRRDTAELIADLVHTLEELRKTEADLIARNEDVSEAQRAATNALNDLNAAQKCVDELVEQLRDTRHGDWARCSMIPAHLGHCSGEASE